MNYQPLKINFLKFKIPKVSVVMTEALGSFVGQENESERLAIVFFEMIKNDKKKENTSITIDGEVIPLELVLEKTNNLMGKSVAEIEPFGEKFSETDIKLNNLRITLYLSKFDLLSLSEKQLMLKISKIISHELMHGNIFSKRIKNHQDINIAEWYESIHDILANETNEMVRGFAYALYACYYQEKQSIISSVYTQLVEKFLPEKLDFIKNKLKDLSYEEKYNFLLNIFKEELVNTEAYQTYSYILELSKNINEDNLFLIESVLKNYNIKLNVKKEIDKMRIISTEALKDVRRNGGMFFCNFLCEKLLNKKEG